MDKVNESRRTFLKTVGLGAAAFSLNSFTFLDNKITAGEKSYVPKIGIQLYTVRKHIENDFEATMKKVSDTGYMGVETYFLPESITLERAAKIFKDVGLKVFSMHSELPVDKNRDLALRMADAYKCNRVVYAGWPQGDKYKDLDAIKKTAETYNEIAYFLKLKGIKFGLHNHWWEFEMVDGIQPFYYLLHHLDKEIFFEIDTYWAKTGGQDPAKAVKDFGSRAPLLHIKDGPAVKGDKAYEQVPAGKGVMNFPAIVEAGNKNIEWMIVEFDEYSGDIFEGIKNSYDFLISNKLAKGKS